MRFMELRVGYGDWWIISTKSEGTVVMPCDYFSKEDVEGDYPKEDRESDIECKTGWCARYSVPGYLDCTDWCGPYNTEEEAVDECKELYGDE